MSNRKLNKRILTGFEKVMLIFGACTLISGIIIGSLIFFKTNEVKTQPIPLDKKLDIMISFDKLININSLSFHNEPDTLSWEQIGTSYKFGDKIVFLFQFGGLESQRKISVFFVDNNNFVHMCYPFLNSDKINDILNNSNKFENVINNSSSNIYPDEPVEITITPNIDKLIISSGEWRVTVIIWKFDRTTSSYKPSLIISTATLINGYEKPSDYDYTSLIIITALLTIGVILLVYVLIYRKEGEEKRPKEKPKKAGIKQKKVQDEQFEMKDGGVLIEKKETPSEYIIVLERFRIENQTNLNLITKLQKGEIHFLPRHIINEKMKLEGPKKYTFSPKELEEIKKGGLYLDKNEFSYDLAIYIQNNLGSFLSSSFIDKIGEYISAGKELNLRKGFNQQFIIARGLPNVSEAHAYYLALDKAEEICKIVQQLIDEKLKSLQPKQKQ